MGYYYEYLGKELRKILFELLAKELPPNIAHYSLDEMTEKIVDFSDMPPPQTRQAKGFLYIITKEGKVHTYEFTYSIVYMPEKGQSKYIEPHITDVNIVKS